jgi:hypothetical protein
MSLQKDKKITVCDACFKASCWQGIWYCDDYKRAGTVEKTVAELRELGLEHKSYWREAAEARAEAAEDRTTEAADVVDLMLASKGVNWEDDAKEILTILRPNE